MRAKRAVTAQASEEKSTAKKALEAIGALRANKHLEGYLYGRYRQKLDSLERKILDQDNLSVEELTAARVQRKYLKEEILPMLEQDAASARKVLGITGVTSDE